jgi:hypothetical protein
MKSANLQEKVRGICLQKIYSKYKYYKVEQQFRFLPYVILLQALSFAVKAEHLLIVNIDSLGVYTVERHTPVRTYIFYVHMCVYNL